MTQPHGPSSSTCFECGAQCCRHVAVQIDRPACKRDYDSIRWYLMHHNVNVFVDLDGDWMLEFITPCTMLDGNNRCSRYEERPRICRDYPASGDDCVYGSGSEPYKIVFSTAEQFEQYLARKGIRWQWTRMRV